MKQPILTIVEGPDGAGKSVLVDKLAVRWLAEGKKVAITHHGPYQGETRIAEHYLSSMVPDKSNQIWNQEIDAAILDRSWLSESVYGPIVRGACRISLEEAETLTNAALTAEPIVIYCLPGVEQCLENMAPRLKDKYLTDDVKMFRAIYQSFDLQAEWLNSETGLPVYIYNYLTDRDINELLIGIARERLPRR